MRAGGKVPINDRGRLRWRPADKDGAARAGAHLGDVRERRCDRVELPGAGIDLRKLPRAIADEAADKPLRCLEGLGGHAKIPLRLPELRLHRRDGLDRAAAFAIEIPPSAAAIRDEVQFASGRPFGLEHSLIQSAGDMVRVLNTSVRADCAEWPPGAAVRWRGCEPPSGHLQLALESTPS